MELKAIVAEKSRALSGALFAAMQSEDKEKQNELFAGAFTEFSESLENALNDKVQSALNAIDGEVLSNRGVRKMTSKEIKFGEALKASVMADDPKAAIGELDKAFPETIITTVLEDVRTEHPLLNAIDFKDTTVVTKMIYSKDVKSLAKWGALNSGFTEELGAAIDTMNVTFCKLAAYLPIPKDMLEVSPSWLVNLVMMILAEAIVNGLENGVINGTGLNMPIGMRKNLDGAVVGGVYPDKTPVKLNSFLPEEYNLVIARLSRTKEDNPRKVSKVIFVCNPTDYLTKVLPASTMLTPGGGYAANIFPFPTEVIQSEHLDEGEAIIGIPDKYFMGMGMPKSGRIEFSDHAQFMEDVRIYTTKLLGNGQPKDNNAFMLVDISGLKPLVFKVEAVDSFSGIEATGFSSFSNGFAELISLSIGSLTLSPSFNPAVTEYTAETSNSTNGIKIAANEAATVRINVNGAEIPNNTAAAWEPGENLVTVDVLEAGYGKTYTVIVNKS